MSTLKIRPHAKLLSSPMAAQRVRNGARGRLSTVITIAGTTVFLFTGSLRAQELDTARALSALRDAKTACIHDAGALWGKSLCGPIALVDRQTRIVIANDTLAGRHFLRLGGVYVTTLPQNQFVANTSFDWGGRAWTMVALPLPADRFARVDLVMHEVFHREQSALGLAQKDALNNQLDTRGGRTWLRLEYRALARALEALPNRSAARRHTESALMFRAERRALLPGSDSLEASLEIQEGLPEYTGERLAMTLTGEGAARVAKYVRDFEKTPTFVRSFAYGTGPAIGILLDTFAPDWRHEVRTKRDIGSLLAQAINFEVPPNINVVARQRANDYDWQAIDSAEASRELARAPAMREYRLRLVEGPTITLKQSPDSLSWSFDPNELIGFDLRTTIYPSGSFSGPWGKLTVDSGGVLVANDLSSIRVGASRAANLANASEIKGDTWTLLLNPAWLLRADPARAGSYMVEKNKRMQP
jgi:hypothetical protein